MDAVQNAVGRRWLKCWFRRFVLAGLLALSACNLTYNPDAQLTPTLLPVVITPTPIPASLAPTVGVVEAAQTQVASSPVPTQPTVAPISTVLPTVGIPTLAANAVFASSTPVPAATTTPLVPQAVAIPPTQPPLLVDCPVTSLRFSRTYNNPLTISPIVASQDTCYQLQAGASVTLTWPGAPSAFPEVTFYRRDESLDRAEVIGRDANAADGASIQWTVPASLPSSLLYANVTNSADISDSIRVYVG
ncbi:MAG: hypothetical protein H7175_03915 [Burkholderiales bacterium]|nr:hypothetical protein [Anaerolineae bacterium]